MKQFNRFNELWLFMKYLLCNFFWQLGKADGYQNEIVKYKEKLNELEFYKTRVDVRIFFLCTKF